jgi:hypothetical protein
MPRPVPDDDDDDLPPRRKPPEEKESVKPADGARRPKPRREEEFEEDDRPRRRREKEDDEDEDRPRARRRRREEEDDEDDFEDDYEDDRPRRRRKDPIETLIPYHNPKGLAAYYCGVFSLIPILGLILGPIALVFGILGIKFSRQNDRAGGMGHAIAGVILGGLTTLGNWGLALILLFALLTARR